MTPLKDWVEQHPQWKDNKQDMAYLANRCASAFDLVGNHFAVHASLDEQRRSANIFLNHSDTYVRVGYFLTVKQGLSESPSRRQLQRHQCCLRQVDARQPQCDRGSHAKTIE